MPLRVGQAIKNLFTGNHDWSPNTVQMYRIHLAQFESFVGPETELDKVAASDLREWSVQYTQTTFAAKMRAVRALYRRFLPDYRPVFDLSAPTVEAIQSPPLSQVEYQKLLGFNTHDNYPTTRGKAATLLVANGVRGEYLWTLDVDDVSFEYGIIHVPDVILTVKPKTIPALKSYLEIRKQKGPERSFLTTAYGTRAKSEYQAKIYANNYLALVFGAGLYTIRNVYTWYILGIAFMCGYNLPCTSAASGLSPRRLIPILEANGYKDFITWSK